MQEVKSIIGNWEISIEKAVHNNMKVMVGDFQVAAKHYHEVVLPILNLIHKLESGEWTVVRNPAHPANEVPATPAIDTSKPSDTTPTV